MLIKTKLGLCACKRACIGYWKGSSVGLGEEELTSVIGGCWSSLDPGVGCRVLTDDEREAAGLLHTIWPPSVGSRT